MKTIITTTLITMSLFATAQNTATPSNIEGKDIYVLLVNTNAYDFVETVQLSKEQETTVANFGDRIKMLLSNAKSKNFDAITTRDGNTVQLIKYKSSSTITTATVPNYFGKEVYFLSNPTKKHKVIATKELTADDLKKHFYKVAESYTKDDAIVYDAVVISENKVQYIVYK